MIKLTINEEFNGFRIDKLICSKFNISFAVAQKLIRQKKIKINSQYRQASCKIKNGDEVEVFINLDQRSLKKEKKAFIDNKQLKNFYDFVIYEDESILAIDKPSGLATQGGSGIKISVDDFARHNKWQLVHRLDKDTSGILLIAKNKKIADFLIKSFKDKSIKKTYLALVNKVVQKDCGTVNIPLRKKIQGKNEKVLPDFTEGKEAITNFKVLKRFKDYTLIELNPITGRTHQLRVHMKELGYPILNDIKYGGKSVLRRELSKVMCLHAYKIVIKNYKNKNLEITTKLPKFNPNPFL